MPRKTTRRHRQGDTSRQRILEAALAIAAERGYDGTQIGLVTEATGLPASSIYWHFKNKDELLAETLEFSFLQWRQHAPTFMPRNSAVSAEEQVHTRLRAGSQALFETPEFWRLGLMLGLESRLEEPAARKRFLEVRNETMRAIRDWWVVVLVDEGFTHVDRAASRLAHVQVALMDGLYVGVRGDDEWRTSVTGMLDMIASGLWTMAQRWGAEGVA